MRHRGVIYKHLGEIQLLVVKDLLFQGSDFANFLVQQSVAVHVVNREPRRVVAAVLEPREAGKQRIEDKLSVLFDQVVEIREYPTHVETANPTLKDNPSDSLLNWIESLLHGKDAREYAVEKNGDRLIVTISVVADQTRLSWVFECLVDSSSSLLPDWFLGANFETREANATDYCKSITEW